MNTNDRSRPKVTVITHDTLGDLASSRFRSVRGEFAVIRTDLKDEIEVERKLMNTGFRSDFFTLCLVLSGSVIGRIDGEDTRLGPGDLALAVPFRVKQLLRVDEHCHVVAISFTADFLKHVKLRQISEQMSLFAAEHFPVLHLEPAEHGKVLELIERIEQRVEQVEEHTYGLELLVNAFVDLLLETAHIGKNCGTVHAAPFSRKEELVAKFIRMAQEHHLAQRHLAFYSDQLFVTAKYLSETAKEVTGRTAGQLIDEMVLAEAKGMLDEPALSISEVAYRLRFNDPGLFSKFFSRMTGAPPRAYRRALSLADTYFPVRA